MNNIKDKLIEIAKRGVAYNATEFSDEEVILYNGNDFDHACEDIADEIIENLPELLSDSGWVKLPCNVGDTICKYSNDLSVVWCEKIKKIDININEFTIYTKGFRPIKSSEFEIKKLDNEKHIYSSCIYIATQAEAEAKLAKIKEVKNV